MSAVPQPDPNTATATSGVADTPTSAPTSAPSSAALARLDTLAAWRRALDRGFQRLQAQLQEHGLLDAAAQALGQGVRQRLASDRLVLAFVAEFSRGKSELINALFFADTGRRVLPATPGRTTMCPVELAWDPDLPPSLRLLPIATRRSAQTLGTLRDQPDAWQTTPLALDDADALAAALQQVVATRQVPVDEARALGFWSDEQPDDNPPRDERDQVEVPAWRHALINLPHPLLQRGLVVIDTPGLNAIGAEPELTLALLPSAHAAVFLLGADTGVTRSDLAVWRDHLGDRGIERFVVLNKIDTLEDPLLTAAQIEAQVQAQRAQAAHTLAVPPERVFALSARRALAARLAGDPSALAASRLPALEDALLAQLLPQRSQVIGRLVEDGLLALQQTAARRLADRQRQTAEQSAELQSLRGKSSQRLQMISARLAAEAAAFELCGPRLVALRAVLARQLQAALQPLSGEHLRAAVRRMREGSEASFLRLGAARAFQALRTELHDTLVDAERRAQELEQLLQASLTPLNADFGFHLVLAPRPALAPFQREIDRIEAGYSRYLGITQVWRLSGEAFAERFSRLLLSRLQGVFDSAAGEIERWAQALGTQIDEQFRERRRMLAQQRESHARIRTAEDGLEQGIDGLAGQAAQWQRLASSLAADVDSLRLLAATPPPASPPPASPPSLAAEALPRPGRLQLVPGAVTTPLRGAA
jgi:Dynamin family